ncbi:MAG: NAD(P)-dependent oxidoreductase [bacterium]|nr:NAD(P)-dependent oxidoreductase [bacterium]
MRIFVTGGTGFIGTHAVAELAKRGHKLLVLSRRRTVLPGGCVLLRGDLATFGRLEKQIKKFKPDAVLHLGWEGLPDIGPEMSLRNLLYGIDVVRLAVSVGAKKIVISGSMFEYGEAQGAIKEEDGPHPIIPVSAAKTALRFIGQAMAKQSSIDFVWAIFFSVYGPGQKPHSLIPHLLERMRLGLALDVKNPGAANDFVYVTDVVRALALILEKHKPGQNDTYNVGSGKLTSVKDVVREIYGKEMIRTRVNPGYYADITRMKKEFGWKPKVGIKEGIRKTLKNESKTEQ